MSEHDSYRSGAGEAERYVLPVGVQPRIDEQGFLRRCGDDRRGAPSSPIKRIDELAGQRSSFVLLGAGGSGKTHALKQLRELEDAEYADLALNRPEVLRAAVERACTKGVPLCLDTVDLFRSQEPEAFSQLSFDLADAFAAHVPLRLACRTAAWRSLLSRTMRTAELPFVEFALLPLDRKAAQHIVAQELEVDGTEFIDTLLSAGRGRLAASPQRLRSVARYWRDTGALPRSELTAIDYEIRAFLEESNEQRSSPLAMDHAVKIAQRLATIVTFTPVKAFTTGPGNSWARSVRDLPSDSEPEYPAARIMPEHLDHVVASPLFEPVAIDALSFRHQHYAEFLAAAYLHDRAAGEDSILKLLGVAPDGLLPGSRASAAAWVLSLKPGLAPRIVPGNAITLLRSDIEIASDEVRHAMVEDIFDLVSRDSLAAQWGIDLALATHPGLEGQLSQRLELRPVTDVAMWWIARLAMAGGCRDIALELARCALDAARDPAVRRVLVRTVAHLAVPEAMDEIAAIVPLPHDDDPDCELAGAIIDHLYPTVLTISQLLPLLGRDPATENLYGGYLRALQALPQRAPTEHLPNLLNWLSGAPNGFGWISPIDEIFVGLVDQAWRHRDEEGVADALARLLFGSDHSQRWLLHQNAAEAPPWFGSSLQLRLRLILAVALLSDEQSIFKFLELQLIGPEDVLPLLDELPAMPQHAAETVTACMSLFAGRLTPQVIDRVRALDASHPAYRLNQYLPGSYPAPLGAAKAVADVATAVSHERSDALDSLLDALAAALEASNRDLHTWWKAIELLSYDEHAQASARIPGHDLTLLPGWGLLTHAEQAQFLEQGLAYVRAHTPRTRTLLHNPIRAADVLPDWSGIYLLATLMLHFPERLDEVTEDVWTRWAPTIATAPESQHASDADVRRRLIARMPPAARNAAADATLDHLDQLIAADRYVLPSALTTLIPELAPRVARLLTEGRCSTPLAVQLLDLLVANAVDEGLPTCRTLAVQADGELSMHARLLRARHEPDQVINELPNQRPALQENAEVLEHLPLGKLNDQSVASLAERLLVAYPYADDPTSPSSEPDQDLRRLRDGTISQLIERGLPDALKRLQAGRPTDETALFSRAARAARQRQVDLSTPDLSPEAVLKLLERGDHRLVRSDADLVDVVIGALRHLQRTLTDRTAWRDVWDGTDHPKNEDTISDWIRNRLEDHFGRFVIIDREGQVARYKEGGIGTRIDLTFTVATATRPAQLARILIEAKRVDNPEVETHLLEQLDRRYLAKTGLSHGIFLIYWADPAQLPGKWTSEFPTTEHLLQYLTNQIANASTDSVITPFILDISNTVAKPASR